MMESNFPKVTKWMMFKARIRAFFRVRCKSEFYCEVHDTVMQCESHILHKGPHSSYYHVWNNKKEAVAGRLCQFVDGEGKELTIVPVRKIYHWPHPVYHAAKRNQWNSYRSGKLWPPRLPYCEWTEDFKYYNQNGHKVELHDTTPVLTVSDFSEGARVSMASSLRQVAYLIENGVDVISGGIVFNSRRNSVTLFSNIELDSEPKEVE